MLLYRLTHVSASLRFPSSSFLSCSFFSFTFAFVLIKDLPTSKGLTSAFFRVEDHSRLMTDYCQSELVFPSTNIFLTLAWRGFIHHMHSVFAYYIICIAFSPIFVRISVSVSESLSCQGFAENMPVFGACGVWECLRHQRISEGMTYVGIRHGEKSIYSTVHQVVYRR